MFYAVGVLALTVLLAGCGGGGSPSSLGATGLGPATGLAPASATQSLRSRVSIAAAPLMEVHPNHRKTWVAPDVGGVPRLLFESDAGYNEVNIYAMPKLTLKGQVTGFNEPQGECADKSGNIWVANTLSAEVVQLSRKGSILKTLSDPGEYPVSCAVDPTTGDLAVTNVLTTGSQAGNVEIYKNASGTPAALTCQGIVRYFFAGFDGKGDLMVSGLALGGFGLCYGTSSSLARIALNGGTVTLPGAVQWSAADNYWNVFDQQCNVVFAACDYWVTVSGSAATVTGVTTPENSQGAAVCDLVQGVVAANGQKYITGADYEPSAYLCKESGGAKTSVDRWANPAGGLPTNFYSNSEDMSEPLGAAISTK